MRFFGVEFLEAQGSFLSNHEPAAVMTKNARRRLHLALSVVVATALVVVAAYRVDWRSVGGELIKANPLWLLLGLVFYLGIVVLWSTQWRSLLPRRVKVPFARIFEIVSVMAMVANTIPYGVGHGTGAYLLSTRGKVGHAVAVSVLAMEQLAEGTSKLVLVLIVALLIPLPGWLVGGMVGLTGSVLVLITAFLIAIAFHRFPLGQRFLGKFERLPKLRRFAERLVRHLESVRDWRVFGLGLICTFGMKLSEAMGIAAVQLAFGLEPTIGGVLLVLVSTNIATIVSLVPGNLGVYEGAAYLAYSYQGVPSELAVSLAVVHHFCTLTAMVGTGYVTVVTRGIRVPWSSRQLPEGQET